MQELSRQYPAWLHNAIQFAIPLALTGTDCCRYQGSLLLTSNVTDAKIRAVKYFCRTLHKRAMISNLGGRLTNHLNGVHLTPDQRHRWSLQLHQQVSYTHILPRVSKISADAFPFHAHRVQVLTRTITISLHCHDDACFRTGAYCAAQSDKIGKSLQHSTPS